MGNTSRATTTVLVVEDNVDAREVFAYTIRMHGYLTLEAGNGIEALQRLGETPVQLILTDFRMPEMDGLQMASAIKQTPGYAAIPMILLTATPLADKHAMLKEFEAVLLKPCSVDELLATVDRVAGFSPS
ncbi:response regulator [Herbaspirillum sp. YR522]|uniref:response regulator n=1 Tax=Herbaspirillum sp. YR522 TaxID=1144342 RepID=UPI00026F8886|nr:response regulator [Herbaspirillum sp. YR522]EJN00828.1 response regulator with CheY-like receiver, AAA-type ATPase, and DNA-binding domains [Herbaspirillum sp. YR522]